MIILNDVLPSSTAIQYNHIVQSTHVKFAGRVDSEMADAMAHKWMVQSSPHQPSKTSMFDFCTGVKDYRETECAQTIAWLSHVLP